jgi:hypothetical protein
VYYRIKMRAAFNSLMVALVVTALFWGNCFSCPQILLAAQKHHCCPHDKAGPTECKTQGLRNFVKAEQITQIAPPTAIAAVRPQTAALPLSVPAAVPVPAIYTPPDLLPLRI